MEYIAIRENILLDRIANDKEYKHLMSQKNGDYFKEHHVNNSRVCEKRSCRRKSSNSCQQKSPESEPMIIGRNFLVKVNTNIGNSDNIFIN